MPPDTPHFSVGLLSKNSLIDWHNVQKLFGLWNALAPTYFPNRFDITEPIRRPLTYQNLETMKECWEQIVHFKRTKAPWIDASCLLEEPYPISGRYSSLLFSAEYVEGLESEILKFTDQAAAEIGAHFSYVHMANNLEKERDRESKIDTVSSCGINDKFPSVSIHTKHLKLGIPNLYWRTWLSREYIDAIGTEKLSNCPIHSVKWLHDDLVMLQLTEFIDDSLQHEEEFEKIRNAAKNFLGFEFFQPASWPEGYKPLIDILNDTSAANRLK